MTRPLYRFLPAHSAGRGEIHAGFSILSFQRAARAVPSRRSAREEDCSFSPPALSMRSPLIVRIYIFLLYVVLFIQRALTLLMRFSNG